MSNLLELAARCEQAEGPDLDLNEEIAFAVVPNLRIVTKAFSNFRNQIADDQGWFKVPAYTASLDAAMSLVPEGHGGSFTFFKDGTAKAFVWQPYPLALEAKAATLPLALCAAALRARAAQ